MSADDGGGVLDGTMEESTSTGDSPGLLSATLVVGWSTLSSPLVDAAFPDEMGEWKGFPSATRCESQRT